MLAVAGIGTVVVTFDGSGDARQIEGVSAYDAAGADTALLVGHNPGLEELVLALVPDAADQPLRDDVELKFPTASVAELAFDGDWHAVKPNAAVLKRFTRPRDLDPALGPDEG